jgi:Fe-S-cluster-containing dehydrogenase component
LDFGLSDMDSHKSEDAVVSDRHKQAYARLLEEHHALLNLSASVDRRNFLKLMGASLALAGLTGCRARQPVEKIVPYVRQPEAIIPGKPLFYATAMTLAGYAIGLLVESHEGRPTKIEGNPQHAASLGGTDVFAQASVLDLYDPDRSQTPLYLGEIRTWGDFLSEFRPALATQRVRKGAGLRILTETISSPTLADQLQSLLNDFPEAKWHQYEPINRDNVLAGARLSFGEFVETIYHFDKANVVLSLDSDFMMGGPASVRYARDFMTKRRVRQDKTETNRLYVAECTPSNTGAIADHRLAVKASEVESLARGIAAALGVNSGPNNYESHAEWIAAVARDLQANRGASIVIAGEQQPPFVHALVHQINQSLGNIGSTIGYTDPVIANPTIQLESLRQLVSGMDAGQVELLVILGGNPIFNAPADFHFVDSLAKVPLRVHHGLYYDETSALCHWHINAAHYLESWSDARAYDGTVSLVQPLIAPLYSGKTAHEMLAAFTDQPDQSSYDILRGYWMRKRGSGRKGVGGSENRPPGPTDFGAQRKNANLTGNQARPVSSPTTSALKPALPAKGSNEFEEWWSKALSDGFIVGTASTDKKVSLKLTDLSAQGGSMPMLPENPNTQVPTPNTLELVFRPDVAIYDGRFANNGWLQELPKPLTKLTWDNAALISPNTARRFGLSTEADYRGGEHGTNTASVIELSHNGRSVRAPIWIVPGHADDAVTVQFGYGRTRAGSLGSSTSEKPVGFDVYPLRTSDGFWFASGVEIKPTRERYALACTQAHYNMEGRELIRSATFDEYRRHPEFAKREADRSPEQISLYPGWKYNAYAWGMSIDTGACIGCNVCVVACQAENNIPVVGKEEVMHAREMHWIRLDRYFEEDEHNPRTSFQPVPCMHCENAPCELVCPVEATTHSDEGLNEMTYNRCVGTRYCSNNCPYKVRRFNFFEYSRFDSPLVKLQRNPDVSVRSRGVMEKCTYCVQRISAAKIQAEEEGRPVRDGEIIPACQQACPVEAIIFGDINDPNSRVSRLKGEPTDYGLLAELNTRPRTTYLAKIRNPNQELGG